MTLASHMAAARAKDHAQEQLLLSIVALPVDS